MNFIKIISILILIPTVVFSYSCFYFENDTLQSTAVFTDSPIQEEVLTKLATTLFEKMGVEATIDSVFITDRTNSVTVGITFPATEIFSPVVEFKIFYSLIYTIFMNFPSINYVNFVKPVFIKYISTKDTITRDEVKYEDK
jgi:hypothetical protein